MKKSKLSLGLISCLLAVGALAGCNEVKSSKNGVLMRYSVNDNDKPIEITADEILKEYYDDSSKYQAIFDTINSVIVRNYFADNHTKEYLGGTVTLGKVQMDDINAKVDDKIQIDIATAKENAENNNTRYKKELEAIFESNGVESLPELEKKYREELQKEQFEFNFNHYYVDEIKNGDPTVFDMGDGNTFKWDGYLKDEQPYHVSHIMVKLDDSSETNYHNGTIGSEVATRLHTVVNALAEGKKSFNQIAYSYNEDPGSKDKNGNLGIMDYSTGFINEFKLGVYAYEQYYRKDRDTTGSVINIKDKGAEVEGDIQENYEAAVNETFDITDAVPTVKFSVFQELEKYATKEADEENNEVMENSTLVYPRNVLYNKYLNIHSAFFVENDVEVGNFKKVNFGTEDDKNEKIVLCAEVGRDANNEKLYEPIIAVRGSSQGEQEIHFILVNRSPFVATDGKGVTLDEYFTTFAPSQSGYPKDEDGNAKQTYVNFSTDSESEALDKADEFASKLKSYNSDKLEKYAFLRFMEIEGIKFEDNDLYKALMKWIATSVNKKSEKNKETWTKTWDDYLDKLSRQNDERSKLMPEISKKFFGMGNSYKMLNEELDFDTEVTDVEKKELKRSLKVTYSYKDALGNPVYIDADKNGVIDDDELKEYWVHTRVYEAFNLEGGVFNDGKTHK